MTKPTYVEKSTSPIYETVEDFILIGLDHQVNKRLKQDEKTFLDTLLGADHHFAEGHSKVRKLQQKNSKNYEALAAQKLKRRLKPLEQDYRYCGLGVEYGVRSDLVRLYTSLSSLKVAFPKATSEDDLQKILKQHFRDQNMLYPDLKNFDAEDFLLYSKLLYRFLNMGDFGASSDEILHDMNQFYVSFMARIRDAETIGPSMLTAAQLEGKKVALLGSNHLPYQKETLETGRPIKPMTWNEFKAEHKEDVAVEVFRMVENDLFPVAPFVKIF